MVLEDNQDEIIESNIFEHQHKTYQKDKGFFEGTCMSTTIVYNTVLKKIMPSNIVNEINWFIGWLLNYNNQTDLIDVLYKGYLMKDPVQFPSDLKPRYVQNFISSQFKIAQETIKNNMPRAKKLKRLNLKMLNRKYARELYEYFDSFIENYSELYGRQQADILKANIATRPFYIIDDDGFIKLYDLSTNQLTLPDIESTGYFLAYFSFVNNIKKV